MKNAVAEGLDSSIEDDQSTDVEMGSVKEEKSAYRTRGCAKCSAHRHRITSCPRATVSIPRSSPQDPDDGDVSPTDFEVYPAHIAFKIYQKGLENSRCKRIGDGTFFSAKRTWNRLPNAFPTTNATQKCLLPLAFEGDARHVYEEVAGMHVTATMSNLWSALEKRLFNEVHQSTLRDRFFAMRWNEKKESFEKFAWKLRSTALALPGAVDDGLLLNRLKAGMPKDSRIRPTLCPGASMRS